MKGQGIQEYEVVNELPSYFLRATNTHYMSLGGTLLKTPVDNPDALVGAPKPTICRLSDYNRRSWNVGAH